MLIVNRGEQEITGVLNGKPFNIVFNENSFKALKILENQMTKVKTEKAVNTIVEKVEAIINVDYNELVASQNPYLMHNPDKDEYFLIVNAGKKSEEISDIPLPQIMVDYIHESVDKNIDYMPILKAWKNFLISRIDFKESGAFKLIKYDEFLNKCTYFATFLNTNFIDDELVNELVDEKGYTIERATEKATYKDISITQEGILSCYKVAKEITEVYEQTKDEDGNHTGKKLVPMYGKTTKVNPISGEETVTEEKPEYHEDRYFKPAIWTNGEDFYCDGELGQIYRVGQTQWLGRGATINRSNGHGGGGLYIGGLNYIKNFGNDERKTLSCLVNPADIISFQAEGNAMRVWKLFPNNVIEDDNIKLKSIYHSSKYLADSLISLDAEMKAAVAISKEKADKKTIKEKGILNIFNSTL